jgi:hypothetical protein
LQFFSTNTKKTYKSSPPAFLSFQQHLFCQGLSKASTQDKLVDMAPQMLFGLLELLLVVESVMVSDVTSLLAKCRACFLFRFLKVLSLRFKSFVAIEKFSIRYNLPVSVSSERLLLVTLLIFRRYSSFCFSSCSFACSQFSIFWRHSLEILFYEVFFGFIDMSLWMNLGWHIDVKIVNTQLK